MLFSIKDKVKLFSIAFLFSLCIGMFSADNVNFERLDFSPDPGGERKMLSNPGSLCVTGDGLFIIPDFGAGDIKIYEKDGTSLSWVKTIGRMGYGPGELAKPSFSFYDKVDCQLAIMDFGKKNIFVYHKIRYDDFKLVKEIPCWIGAWDIKLVGKRLFISGYTMDKDNNPYDFYCIDLTNERPTYLMPSHYKYGLKSFEEYRKEYRAKINIRAIGIKGWFDIHGDDVYFSWEGDLKIRKLNFVTGVIDQKPFGKKTEGKYFPPTASKKLKEAYKNRDLNLVLKERKKISYVKNILTTSNHVLVIYGTVGQGNWLQYYSFDGRCVKEVSIPGQIEEGKMWVDKENQILYSIVPGSSGSNRYSILKYEL